jgi:hypothetical protein
MGLSSMWRLIFVNFVAFEVVVWALPDSLLILDSLNNYYRRSVNRRFLSAP